MQPASEIVRRHFWVVALPAIAVAALLNAKAVGELVGVVLTPERSAFAAAPAMASRGESASAGPASAASILARNAFDHVAGSLSAPTSDEDDPFGTANDPARAPRCDALRVMAIAASSEADWSFAAFYSRGDKSVLLRLGGQVGGRRVRFIGPDRVWLEDGRALCQVSLFDREREPAMAAPPPAPSTSLDPAIAKGIQKVGPSAYEIDRAVFERVIDNQGEFLRKVRIAPERDGDRTTLRLLGIRPDSLLALMGLQNEDRLESVNGYDVSNPERALEAFARLRMADKVSIRIERGRRKTDLDYAVR